MTTNEKQFKEILSNRPFLNVNEAAEYIGVSVLTLYHYTHKKALPFYKLRGRRLYFKKEDLDNFILSDENRRKSMDEIEKEAIKRLMEL